MKKLVVIVLSMLLLVVSSLQAKEYGGDCSDFESLLSIGSRGVTNVDLYVFTYYDRPVMELPAHTNFEVTWGPRCANDRFVMWAIETGSPEYVRGWISEGDGYFGNRYVSLLFAPDPAQ